MPVDDNLSVALLHFNGADASTTFTDESGKTWTATANAQIDTDQFKFGAASGLFDGTGDFISSADSIDWQLDGGSNANKWTIDFWVRFNGDPGTGLQGFVQQRTDNNNYWSFFLNNNNLFIQVRDAGVETVLLSNAWNPASATWYHLAIVKDGTNGYMMFVDGAQVGTTQTDTSTLPNLTGGINVGRHVTGGGAAGDFTGWMDELRISKGVARWVANFTPPTAEYAPEEPGIVFFS